MPTCKRERRTRFHVRAVSCNNYAQMVHLLCASARPAPTKRPRTSGPELQSSRLVVNGRNTSLADPLSGPTDGMDERTDTTMKPRRRRRGCNQRRRRLKKVGEERGAESCNVSTVGCKIPSVKLVTAEFVPFHSRFFWGRKATNFGLHFSRSEYS